VARIIFQPGGSIGWHTHPGPVIVTVASGALSIINASDCVHRVYAAGKAFIDPGQGNVHVGFNETDGETVVYATFLDVPAGQPATIPADNPGCTV
jgi:quercetin dioxygenase-like cupin family protein